MEMFLKGTLLFTGVFLVSGALMIHTKDAISALLFKVVPMLCGLACLLSALYVFGLIAH